MIKCDFDYEISAIYGWDKEDRAFVVHAAHDANPGDEMFITYKGAGLGMPNAALWFFYGFLAPGETIESFSLLYQPDLQESESSSSTASSTASSSSTDFSIINYSHRTLN
jgi:hypothetical protein